MAVRPIDANALREEFKRGVNVVKGICNVNQILHNIDTAPTLDYEPIIHAHWKYADGRKTEDKIMIANHFIYKCSNCENFEEIQTKFCCSCGAKMDKEVKE